MIDVMLDAIAIVSVLLYCGIMVLIAYYYDGGDV